MEPKFGYAIAECLTNGDVQLLFELDGKDIDITITRTKFDELVKENILIKT